MQQECSKSDRARTKYKFLPRTLRISSADNKCAIKARLKGLHLRKISDQRTGKNILAQFKPKFLKYLTDLKIFSLAHPQRHELIKSSKNLQKYQMKYIGATNVSRNYHKIKQILMNFTRLPKKIKELDFLFAKVHMSAGHFLQFYKKISYLRKLSNLKGQFATFDENDKLLCKENELMNRYLRRLPCLEDLTYCRNMGSQKFLWQLMKDDKPWPYITSLELVLKRDIFANSGNVIRFLREETNELRDHTQGKTIEGEGEWIENANNNQNIPEAAKKTIQTLKEEIQLFFKFNLFKNLQTLNITIARDCLIPLEPEIIKGFSHLNKLKKLAINLEVRPVGTKNIFEGILQLPLLTSFDLKIPFIREEDNVLLTEFLQKQTELTHLGLITTSDVDSRRVYLEQNRMLENIWLYLETKPHLQYLSLKGMKCPIQSLSKGLAKVPLLNKLKELHLDVFDDIFHSSGSASTQIEGFCNFLRRHKSSLRKLSIELDSLIQHDIATTTIAAISEIEGLMDLQLYFEGFSLKCSTDAREEFFKKMYPEADISKTNRDREYLHEIHLALDQTIRSLKNLYNLSVSLTCFNEKADIDTLIRLLVASNGITNLKQLTFRLGLEEDMEKCNSEAFGSVLSILGEKTLIDIISEDLFSSRILRSLLNKIRERQSLRCDLMF